MFRDFAQKNGPMFREFLSKNRPIWAAHPRIAFLWKYPPPPGFTPAYRLKQIDDDKLSLFMIVLFMNVALIFIAIWYTERIGLQNNVEDDHYVCYVTSRIHQEK